MSDADPKAETEVGDWPLWITVAKEYREKGLTYGSTISIAELAPKLGEEPGSVRLVWALLELKNYIFEHWGLASRQNGGQIVFLRPEEHGDFGQQIERRAARAMGKAFKVYRYTPREALCAAEAKRINHLEEKCALKLLILQRTERVRAVLAKNAPNLLKQPKRPNTKGEC